jgi:hypothetical protein
VVKHEHYILRPCVGRRRGRYTRPDTQQGRMCVSSNLSTKRYACRPGLTMQLTHGERSKRHVSVRGEAWQVPLQGMSSLIKYQSSRTRSNATGPKTMAVLPHELLAHLWVAQLCPANACSCNDTQLIQTSNIQLQHDKPKGLPLSASCTNASATAWLSPSSSVKRSLLQSQLAPRRRSWLVMKPPYLYSIA